MADETPQGDGSPAEVVETSAEKKQEAAATETDWKAEARKWESRAKENLAAAKANEDAAKRLIEIEESKKTEDQKRAERIEQLERELNGFKQREQVTTWAAEIVKDSAIPASALRGSTREELEEHFEQLKALVPAPTPKATPPGKSPQDRDKPSNAVAALRQLRKG